MVQEHYRTKDQTTAIVEYIKTIDTMGWLFISLTMKQSDTHLTERGSHTVQTDWVSASRSFRHFHNRLSQIVLKSKARKKGQKVKVIPVIECANGTIHYHCAIEPTVHDKVFWQTVKHCWLKSSLGLRNAHVTPITCDGWVDYVHKTKSHNYNVIDWQNCYWGR